MMLHWHDLAVDSVLTMPEMEAVFESLCWSGDCADFLLYKPAGGSLSLLAKWACAGTLRKSSPGLGRSSLLKV